MPIPTVSVGILGLGRIGAAFGLALKRASPDKDAKQRFHVTAYDPRAGAQAAAERLNAADAYARNPADAAAEREIVLLALPYADVQAAYRAIAPVLRSGAVVLDASPLKRPSIEWAGKHLPEHAHMVGITPVIDARYLFTGTDEAEHAAPDLFRALLLVPSVKAVKEAVELAADFAAIIGADAHFVDPVEHDGLIAATEGVPALLSAALFHAIRRSEGWTDARRIGNPALGKLTYALNESHPDDIRDLVLHNRENTVRYLDAVIDLLAQTRDALATNDRAAIEALVIGASQEFAEWRGARAKGEWDKPATPNMNDAQGALTRSLFGGLLGGKRRKDG